MRADTRPVYLNLLRIRLPIPGIASILHRLSGVLLFLSIPFLIYLMQLALSGDAGYARAAGLLASPFAALLLFVLLWSFLHHLLAGVRYLLIDVHIGVERPVNRYSAWVVVLAAPLLAAALTGLVR